MVKKLISFLIAATFFPAFSCSDSTDTPPEKPGPEVNVIFELHQWLAQGRPGNIEDQVFAAIPLTAAEAGQAIELIYPELLDERIGKYREGWNNSELEISDYRMKIHYTVYGEKPADGRSLYISLHGGGNTTADVNNGQWENQKRLYRPEEGVYLCPRAAVDDWNMWFQEHCDEFYDAIILMAVAELNVNPDKVYIMGYSAGGDGVYRMAPRMADRWAAAAMMAGHPGNVSAVNLRNIGFTLWMGGVDSAYDRNKTAEEFGAQLAELQKNDPAGYVHEVHILPGKPHWMDLEDAAAVPWMARFRRNPLPDRVAWNMGDLPHPSFYWLSRVDTEPGFDDEIYIRRDGNRFDIIKCTAPSFRIALNDQMVDMDSPVTVYGPDGSLLYEGEATRTCAAIFRSIEMRCDDRYIFSSYIDIEI